MVAGLAVPLDEWVCASARPPREEILEDIYSSSTRPDYSTLGVADAFPLLVRVCKTKFGNLSPLEFNVKESRGPLMYSAALTVTGPDEVGIEFPNSGSHISAEQAKLHAAYRAVREGAIEFIQQCDILKPTCPQEQVPPPGSGNHRLSSANKNTAYVSSRVGQPAKATEGSTKSVKPQHPTNTINILMQRIYSQHKKSMPKSSQEWETAPLLEGVTAQLTIRLPSGQSRTYGSLARGATVYPTLKDAKVAVAKQAIESGVLDFIQTEEPNSQLTQAVSVPLPAHVAAPTPSSGLGSTPLPPSVPRHPRNWVTPSVGPPLPDYVGVSTYVAFDPSAAQSQPDPSNPQRPLPSSLPPKPMTSSALAMLPAKPRRSNRKVTSNTTPVGPSPHQNIPPQLAEPVPRHPSPLEEGEVEDVDDMLGPASNSKPSSIANDSEKDQLVSDEEGDHSDARQQTDDPRGRSIDEGEDVISKAVAHAGGLDITDDNSNGQSEAMELDSSDGKAQSIRVPDSAPAPEVSGGPVGRSRPPSTDEPAAKKQRTESPLAKVPEDPPQQAMQVMSGATYSNILAEFCSQTGRAQPQVTYYRDISDTNSQGRVMYHVSIVVGTSRYELSKSYESVQLAEEKLSKRILRLFGVRAKKH